MANDDVNVKFGADIGGLTAGIDAAKGQIEGFGNDAQSLISSLSGVGEALAAAFAVDKISEFERQFADLGTSIERTAKITGLSTEEVEQFGFGIALAGGDAGTAAQTLKILEKNIGDAEQGSGKAFTAFSNLGISLDDLKTKSPIDIIAQMKTRMDEAGDSAGQAALKIEYMRTVAGRAGADFLALDGNLDKIKKQFEDTGAAMSPEMVEHSTKLHASLTTLEAAWQGIKNMLADDVAPAYNTVIDLTTTLIEKLHQLGEIKIYIPLPPGLKEIKEGLEELDQATHGGAKDLGEGQFGPANQKAKSKPLPVLETGNDGAADNSAEQNQIAIEKSNLQENLEMYKLDQQSKKLSDQAKVDSGQMSNAQMLADLRTSLEGEKQASLDEIIAERDLYDDDSAAWVELNNKKLIVAKQYDNQIQQLAVQSAKAQQKTYDDIFKSIQAASDQMVNGILQGTQTWKQAMGKLFDDLALKFLDDVVLKGVLDWAKGLAEKSGLTEAWNQLMVSLGFAQGAETAAATGAGALAGQAAQKAAALLTIETDAAVSAAGAFATAASIPGGIVAAPEAAAAAYGEVMSFAGLASAAGGMVVDQDQIAMVHQNEMILPANLSSGISNMIANGGSATQSGGQVSVGFTINAIDTQTGMQFINTHAATITNVISNSIRNNNGSFRNPMQN